MELTEETALRAYAIMLNTMNIEPLISLLADDFIYESQKVFQPLKSKQEFLEFIVPKLETIRKSGVASFGEMGSVYAYGKKQPCVIMAHGHKSNLIGLALAKIHEGKLKRLGLCIIPPPETATRSEEYPTEWLIK